MKRLTAQEARNLSYKSDKDISNEALDSILKEINSLAILGGKSLTMYDSVDQSTIDSLLQLGYKWDATDSSAIQRDSVYGHITW